MNRATDPPMRAGLRPAADVRPGAEGVDASRTRGLEVLIILPDLADGGAERLHVTLASLWHARGAQVRFALMRRRGEFLDLLPQGIEIDDLRVDRIRHAVLPLASLLRRRKPDIVLSAMWPLTTATVAAWMFAGRPGRLFLSDHSHLSTACADIGASPATVRRTMQWSYRFADGVIAVSQEVKEDLCQLSGLVPSRIRVIHNPAATGGSPQRADARERERLWGAGHAHHILSVGKLKPQKDHATLIQAFALLPESLGAKLTIVGDGPLRPELERLAAASGAGARIAMPGFVRDPSPWYRSADLFVLSSTSEGFGNVLVEALECGLPIVSTHCSGGPAEILEGGRFGRLVPPRDPAALAAAIAEALAAPCDREALVARAQDFSADSIAAQYLAYFRERYG